MLHKGTWSAIRMVQATTDVAFPQCVALLVSADVTATVTMANGVAVANVPLKAGYNPLQCTKVVFASGTVHALYN
jgi:ABC-type uncharacterized transport system permease subunit